MTERTRRLWLSTALRTTGSFGAVSAAAALGVAARPAHAALAVGADAPDFTVHAARGGETFSFTLSQALQAGPVVLYFYPKAFTSGCTVEAHAFAEATPRFEAMGATVVGLSNDDIETLKKFSVEACRNRFAVGADDGARVIKAYDAGIALMPRTASRISYVISPQRKVLLAYAAMSPDGHVDATMKAVEAWKRR